MIRLYVKGNDNLHFISDTPLEEFTLGFITKGLVLYPEKRYGEHHIIFDMEGKTELILSDEIAVKCIKNWLKNKDDLCLSFEQHPFLKECLLAESL